MNIYRFELSFDGRPQGIGFLQGIDEMGLPLKEEIRLLEMFDSLPCPTLGELAFAPIQFWFTEKGFFDYYPAFVEYRKTISHTLWRLILEKRTVTKKELAKAVYNDIFQAAWNREDIRFDPKKANEFIF